MIYRVNKSVNYSVIDNRFLHDPRLSWKAKGLLGYLLSKPNDWKIYESDLVNHARDGKDAVRSALGELKKYGYLNWQQKRVKGGKFDGYDYMICEVSDSWGELGDAFWSSYKRERCEEQHWQE